MNQISTRQKEIAKRTAAAFDIARPSVARFWDDEKKSNVSILEARDRPQAGVVSYATIGLSEYPLMRNGEEFPARAEILATCGSAFRGVDNVLATIAFCIINSKWFCAPGIIFPGILDMYEASSTMSDIYFSSPFLWDDLQKSSEIEGLRVAWLLAVPISKAETELARKSGPKALEDLFSSKDIDIYDLNRPSVV